HVSYSPLVDPVVTYATEWTRQVALGPRRAPRSPEIVASLDQSSQFLIARADEVNGLSALTWGPIGLPTLGALPGPNEDLAFVDGWLDGLALLVACVGVSLLLGGWFYGGLAVASRGGRDGPLAVGRNTPRAVRDVLGLVLVMSGAALLFGVPVLLLIGFTALV